jgi:hypothetical protein
MLRVADPAGKLHDFAGGQILPAWGTHSDEQVQHLLSHNLVEVSDAAGRSLDPDRRWECLSALISLDVPEDAGAPRARDALRSNGFHYSNATVCASVAIRKSGEKFEPPK